MRPAGAVNFERNWSWSGQIRSKFGPPAWPPLALHPAGPTRAG